VDLDASLRAYYDAEAATGRRTELGPLRELLHDRFAERLRSESRRRLLDVGAGPGLDTLRWRDAGFGAVGLDLAPANVTAMRRRGLPAVVGSLYHLPVGDAACPAVWTMSTLVHVPRTRVDEALGELARVTAPGGLLAIGTWGGLDFEGVSESGDLLPFRFFALSDHDTWRRCLARHGVVEEFETFTPTNDVGWEYQFAVVRVPRRDGAAMSSCRDCRLVRHA